MKRVIDILAVLFLGYTMSKLFNYLGQSVSSIIKYNFNFQESS